MTRRRVVIVDDHPIVRQGLSQLFEQEPDLAVSGEAEDVDSAMDVIARTLPDLVLLDISLRYSNGLDLIRFVRSNYPHIHVLVLSLHETTAYAERVMQIGARGFVSKAEPVDNMLAAVRAVLQGGIYVSPPQRSSEQPSEEVELSSWSGSVRALTDRELEVFQLVGEGLNNIHIAENMKLSVKTVETYKAHIKRKLGLSNGTELVERAVRWNIGRLD